MTPADRKLAAAYRAALEAAQVPVRQFIVFGSRARGDADAESDMDVFLEIAEDGVDVRRRISDAAWQVGYDNGVIICNLILTSDEMANSPQRYSNCVETALEEGVPV